VKNILYMEVIKGVEMPPSFKEKFDKFIAETVPGDMVKMFYIQGVLFTNRFRAHCNRYYYQYRIKTKRSPCKQYLQVWRVE
jgi:hypothetical protein